MKEQVHEDETLHCKELSGDGDLRGDINNDETTSQHQSSVEQAVDSEKASEKETNLIDLTDSSGQTKFNSNSTGHIDDKGELNTKEKCFQEIQNNLVNKAATNQVRLVKTSCGDAHNIGLDLDGRAYSLPSPLDFDPFPSGSKHKASKWVFTNWEFCKILYIILLCKI